MAGFIYYLPGKDAVTDDILKDAGLEYLTRIVAGQRPVLANGPDGEKGIAFTVDVKMPLGGSKPKLGVYPKKQTWRECNKGKFWLGMENENMPQPKDLLRAPQLQGYYLDLGDANAWLIPVARHFVQGSPLPRDLMLGVGGEVMETVMGKYIPFSKRSEDIYHDLLLEENLDELAEEGGILELGPNRRMTIQNHFEIVSEAMGFNYTISKWEISALCLLNSQNIKIACMVIIDFCDEENSNRLLDAIEAKKKAQSPDLTESDSSDIKEAS